jgi:peptide deformylase
VKVPDPVLRQKAQEVSKISKKTQALIDDMVRVMKLANGIGLAAPQVGKLERVIVVATPGIKPTPMINPKVLKVEGKQVGQEGCLSIPGLYGDVERAQYVEVEALDRRGKEVVFELEDLAARVALHEIDHLDGVLFTDKVDPSTLHWEHPQRADDPAE